MSNPLYAIANEHQQIIEAIDSGEFTPEEMADTLEGAAGTFEEKAQSVLAYAEGLSADIDQVDAQIKRMQERKKQLSNKRQSMRDYLKRNMQLTGITNIKCPLFSITLAKGRDQVIIDDESLIPSDYVDVQVVEKVDNRALLSDLKDGLDIPGCHLEKTDESLRIK